MNMKTLFKSLTEGKSLIKIEFFILCLFIVTLPILEAPKNIFLASFLIIAIFNQFQIKNNQPWGYWDNIFLFYITTSFLSAMFAGIPLHDEWRGFRTVLFTTLFCWVLYRATYKKNQIIFFVFLAITSALIAQ